MRFPLAVILPVPREIEWMIFDLAGPLARWLCRADPGQELETKVARAIWRDAFRNRYRGIKELPQIDFVSRLLKVKDWLEVCDVEYWKFLRPLFDTTPAVNMEYFPSGFNQSDGRFHPLLIAAIKNVWITEMDGDLDFGNELWRFYIAVRHNLIHYAKYVLRPKEARRLLLGTMIGGRNYAEIAAKSGHQQMIAVLVAARPQLRVNNLMGLAADRGHLDTVIWLHRNIHGILCTPEVMDNAVRLGNFHIVKWLHENRTEGCTSKAMDEAARVGHLEMVKFLHLNRPEGCTSKAMDEAASNGHLEVVKFLHSNRTEGCTFKAMDAAARKGYLEVVKFLHYNRHEGCTSAALNDAAENGHLTVVKFLSVERTEGSTMEALKRIRPPRGSGSKNDRLRLEQDKIVVWLKYNAPDAAAVAAAVQGYPMFSWLKFKRYCRDPEEEEDPSFEMQRSKF